MRANLSREATGVVDIRGNNHLHVASLHCTFSIIPCHDPYLVQLEPMRRNITRLAEGTKG